MLTHNLRNKNYIKGNFLARYTLQSLDNSKIRSATGLAVDWLTPIGPLSFSFAVPLTKADSDTTEGFRFDIGTSF